MYFLELPDRKFDPTHPHLPHVHANCSLKSNQTMSLLSVSVVTQFFEKFQNFVLNCSLFSILIVVRCLLCVKKYDFWFLIWFSITICLEELLLVWIHSSMYLGCQIQIICLKEKMFELLSVFIFKHEQCLEEKLSEYIYFISLMIYWFYFIMQFVIIFVQSKQLFERSIFQFLPNSIGNSSGISSLLRVMLKDIVQRKGRSFRRN